MVSVLIMSEQKWATFYNKIERLVNSYNRIQKERDTLKSELEELRKQTVKLVKGSKEDVLLKDRIKFLEEERKLVQEKVKKLLKILREY